MIIKKVENVGKLYFYTITDDAGGERTMEVWHPEGLGEAEREREALGYAKRLFGG